MNLRVAIQAASALEVVDAALAGRRVTERRPRIRAGLTLSCQLRYLCAVRRVTVMAEEWRTHLEHALVDGAMRIVANRAIFGHRVMLVNERPALFHVTLVASLDDAVALHQLRADRAVRIVAIGARDFTLGDRVTRRPVEFGALLLVADETHFGLRELDLHLVRRMHCMAGRTRNVARLVSAAFPVRPL